MARGIKLKAIFGDGTVQRTVTAAGFTHAWRVSGTTVKGKTEALYGWARNKAAAQRAADLYVRAEHNRLRDAKIDIVEAKLES